MSSEWTSPGARLRITAPRVIRNPAVGWVKEWAADTLYFEVDPGHATATFPSSTVRKLEISQGKSGHAVKGAFLGLAAGTFVGLFVAKTVSQNNPGDDFDDLTVGFTAWGVTAAAGLVSGAVIGALLKTERWKPVRP
jgi:hypothetical protein